MDRLGQPGPGEPADRQVLDGDHDELPEQAFYMVGTIDEAVAKARKMAAEFQSQFQEAMREAEMADLKKSFDEVREAASSFSPAGVISSLQQDVSNSLRVEPLDKPAETKPAEAKPAETK